MSSFTTTSEPEGQLPVDVEVKTVALSNWWQRHNRSFSLWYLMLGETKQIETLLQCLDMPKSTSSKDGSVSAPLKATDIIVPELVADTLNGNQGRGVIIFMTSRLVSTDLCYTEDVMALEEIRKRGRLPNFSGAAFKDIKYPFVDRADPTQSIQTVSNASDERTLKVFEEVKRQVEIGNFIHGEVFLAMQLRREMIATLFEGLAYAHQMAMKTAEEKPSPTYDALLKAEIEMRKSQPVYYAPAATSSPQQQEMTRHQQPPLQK